MSLLFIALFILFIFTEFKPKCRLYKIKLKVQYDAFQKSKKRNIVKYSETVFNFNTFKKKIIAEFLSVIVPCFSVT